MEKADIPPISDDQNTEVIAMRLDIKMGIINARNKFKNMELVELFKTINTLMQLNCYNLGKLDTMVDCLLIAMEKPQHLQLAITTVRETLEEEFFNN